MWQREEEIFGSTEFPSPLTLRVTRFSQVEQFDPSDGKEVERFGPVAYALFASIENKQRIAREGIKFDLMIYAPGEEYLTRRRAAQNEQRRKANKQLLPLTIDSVQNDIETALRTWLAFGGLGGRTSPWMRCRPFQELRSQLAENSGQADCRQTAEHSYRGVERGVAGVPRFPPNPTGPQARQDLEERQDRVGARAESLA